MIYKGSLMKLQRFNSLQTASTLVKSLSWFLVEELDLIFKKNDIRDVGRTADLVLVFLVHLVHWYLVHWSLMVPDGT